MPFIADQPIRWTVWSGVFCSLQNVVKKDREDVDGCLFALYPEFKNQIHEANLDTIITISTAFTMNDKKMSGIFCSRVSFVYYLICVSCYHAHNDYYIFHHYFSLAFCRWSD